MLNLEQIIATARNCRDEIIDEMEGAFSDTVDYKFIGKYYPATRWEPEEYPDIEVLGYDEYVDRAVQAVIGIFGDFWNKEEEQIVVDNISRIMSKIDVDFLTEDAYEDKAYDGALDVYWERQADSYNRAQDIYYENLMDRMRESN